jgi:phosphatidylglycerophosphatase C
VKQSLALFDFDGTITTRDTLFELIKFQKGKPKFYLGMCYLSPLLILHKLGFLSAQKAKEAVLSFFFKGQLQSVFQQSCDLFILNALPFYLKKEALAKIEEHKKNNDRVIVVSASAYNWIEGWCQAMNIELIATRLEFKNGMFTGKLSSVNCNGVEKVNRIKEYVNVTDYTSISAYGNSKGDKPMLELADKKFYNRF